jgi:hypothetical protein
LALANPSGDRIEKLGRLQEYGELADELTNKAEDPPSKLLDVL